MIPFLDPTGTEALAMHRYQIGPDEEGEGGSIMFRREKNEAQTAAKTPSEPRIEPSSGSVHLRFPPEVFARLKQEAAAEGVPLSHHVYQLVIKRPERVIHSKRDKRCIVSLKKEVEKLRESLKIAPYLQSDETLQLREQLSEITVERDQLAWAKNYVNQQNATLQAYQNRIRSLEQWEAFGNAVQMAMQFSEEIRSALLSSPMVARFFGDTKSP